MSETNFIDPNKKSKWGQSDVQMWMGVVVSFDAQKDQIEKGYGWNDWNRYVIELEYELIPESIEPSFDEGICNDYSYQSDNLDGTREEGYFECTDDYSTTGKGTDFDINTDPEDIISEMEENKKDPTNRDEVMEWLQSNYKTE